MKDYSPQLIQQEYKIIKEGAKDSPWNFVSDSSLVASEIAGHLAALSLGADDRRLTLSFHQARQKYQDRMEQYYWKGGKVGARSEETITRMKHDITDYPRQVNQEVLPNLVDAAGIKLPEGFGSPVEVVRQLPFNSLIRLVRQIVPGLNQDTVVPSAIEMESLVRAHIDASNLGDYGERLKVEFPQDLPEKQEYLDHPELNHIGELAARLANYDWQLAKMHQYNLEMETTGTSTRLAKSQFNSFDEMVRTAYFEEYGGQEDPMRALVLTAFKIYQDIEQF